MTMLLPFISEQFDSPIFRLEIDELTETLVAELRNKDGKQVSFVSVSLSTGKTNFNNFTTPERWLTGIEAIYEGVLLLHSYQTETGPAHKGLTGIDAANSQTLWSNYTITFDHLSTNGPVAFSAQIQPKKLFVIDVKTGQIIRSYQSAIDNELNNSIILPKNALSNEVDLSRLNVEPHGNLIYIDHNNFRIVSLHTFENGRLQQHLYVISEDEIVYEDLLNDNIQKMQPEAFILHKNRLIYIKNRSWLCVLHL